MLNLLLVLTTSTCLLSTVKSVEPIATGGPAYIVAGKDALLTCVVSENRRNNTVIWKKGDEILTAGTVRVTSDPRVSVLHDEEPNSKVESGGEVWVLLIKRLKPSDKGSYICELNSDPVLRSIHILDVKKTYKTLDRNNTNSNTNRDLGDENSDVFLVPPPLDSTDNRSFWRTASIPAQVTHDFTECCERANVSQSCMGFCNVHNILDGTTGIEPEACEKDFPRIVRCMADGRNHVPCCVEKQIPDLCQDMCRGEYTPFGDMLRTRVSCVHHTLSGLQCILQGVQQIPSTPLEVTISEVSETGVTVSWSPPEKLPDTVKEYKVNLTELHSFDEDDDDDAAAAGEEGDAVAKTRQAKKNETVIMRTVNGNITSIRVADLKPQRMYGIVVTAENEFGSSLPSERLRIFTHKSSLTTEVDIEPASKTDMPDLPDIRSCCESKGMTHRMCLDKMCDPQKTDLATLPDFMVCAPWSNITFSCLANNIDHTPCCRARGIPSACFPLCSGKVSTLDFNLFKCLRFMSEFSSCLFQGYGVLADPPTKLRTVAKKDTFLILDWNKPKRLADTITTFHVKFRRLGVGDDYSTVVKKNPPLILEGLEPEVYYEFYVVSINAYGKSEPSPRLITRTKPIEVDDTEEPNYNMSKCCHGSGLLPQCVPLCSYNIKLSDIEKLGPACRAQMSIIAKCAAGGRDHTPCCVRRGVPSTCMSLCRGVLPVAHTSSLATGSVNSNATTDCLSYAGNILQCQEEGTDNIPAPVVDLHATKVTNSTISLAWSQPDVEGNNNSSETTTTSTTDASKSNGKSTDDANAKAAKEFATEIGGAAAAAGDDDIDFIVQYGKVNDMTMYEIVAKLENELVTNETSIDLINLEPHALYRIMVLTRGKYGTSLPSSMLLINTTAPKNTSNAADEKDGQQHIYAAPSPPHSLAIIAHSATWMQLTWQPPEYSHPHEKITYRVYHKPTKAEKFNKIETRVAWLRMGNLKPSSQHILYVEAVGEKATSMPSETLVAWTDPALPAFVDPPTVHPADNVPEGGSMTILCLALGNPAPTISLYVGGHLVRQDASRHMVTVIHNVTADMEHVSCYADNGYGVPMQATRKVNICYPPKIQAAGITVASVGNEVELRCMVDSKPKPKTIFWRDIDGRVPVIEGGNYHIMERINESHPNLYTMVLRINKLQASDVGDYFCHAENPYGSKTIPVSVRMRTSPSLNHNVTECCAQMNVSMSCRSACSYYVDIDAIADKPECIVEFDKMMRCAADGSDHRSCCADSNVPRKCLNWCRGEPVRSKEICSLQYARTIVGCFESNRDRLPGPPENIAVSVISDSEVVIRWDPPAKNPNAVDGYRIFYHEAAIIGNDVTASETINGGVGGGGVGGAAAAAAVLEPTMLNNATSMQMGGGGVGNITAPPLSGTEVRRIDVKETSVNIDGLKKDVLYELVVKAGNSYGASVLTEPIKFTLGEHHVTSATTSYSNAVGTISGIVASILAVLLAAAAIIFYRRHRANGKAATGVAFENPTYTRGLEQVQLPTVTSALTHTNGNGNFSRAPAASTNLTTTNTTTPATTASQRPTMTARVGTNGAVTGGGGGVGGGNGGSGAANKTSSLDGVDSHTQCNEVNPTIYEELKLGQEGAGFKKLVP
ncbi:Ig-like and fibronectin type-III domain-containing protein 2 [Musca domestica]|uniref:Ig-like and fibronectin type-III domain-containing protein 2 n=1 Tax=Musca domestica TaxID=7370 RepID=A0ABM3VHQ1_MUSDO|nr:Ig-like and fibronectin type-III domain-containing protein 2 [Musca domestica]XP_058985321.1 Ig-like and fibronectin type-III domain-containing protein 2 [Musca domestica]XP_058985322.1 Ig-like and fibronectin type-III domain-containing protein 2 [Musca domestica]